MKMNSKLKIPLFSYILTTSSVPLTSKDIEILNDEIARQKKLMLWTSGFAIVIALIMPWLGSSKTHGKAMVDYMNYPAAVLSILAVFAFIMLFYYLMWIPKVKRDIKENVKIIWKTVVSDKGRRKYKAGRSSRVVDHFVIIVKETPFRSKDLVITSSENQRYQINDPVTIEYAPHSKKMLNMYKG